MALIKIDPNVFIPMPMALVGTLSNDKPNFMAAGWNTRANANPPMIAVGVHSSHATHDSILENKEFSFCVPSAKMIKETDYCGLVSAKNTDKSNVFEVFYGELKKSPLIKNSIVAMECQLVEAVKLPTNTLFIGEMVSVWGEESILTENNKVDFKKGDAYYLTMPDNNYYNFGESIGHAWKIGQDLK